MKTIIVTGNLEEEIKAIRALEAKINELDELKKEKEALKEKKKLEKKKRGPGRPKKRGPKKKKKYFGSTNRNGWNFC